MLCFALILFAVIQLFTTSQVSAVTSSTYLSGSPSTWTPGKDYGDLLQYEWTQSDAGPDFSRFSAGPAPDSPNLLWKKTVPNLLEYITAFNGKVFIRQGSGFFTYTNCYIVALDAFTGEVVWNTSLPVGYGFFGDNGVYKIDDTHMIVGKYCININTGQILWMATNGFAPGHGWGSGDIYIPERKIFISGLRAWNMSDLSRQPKLIWDKSNAYHDSWGSPVYGDGVVAYGSTQAHYMGLNVTTGELLWITQTKGEMGYGGSFYDGMFIRGGTTDNTVYAFDAKTGKILWEYSPGTWMGFWASGCAVAYGMVYYVNNDHYTYAINAYTGELVWKYRGMIFYQGYPVVADGKVYVTTHHYNAFDWSTGFVGNRSRYTCLDAFTGQVIWQIPHEFRAFQESHCIAYGNLYLIPTIAQQPGPGLPSMADPGGVYPPEVWCISSKPNSWSMWRHDPQQTATGETWGPAKLNVIWKFRTEGAVTSSPAVVDGKVYVGSQDGYLYCLDHWTGNLIWKYKVGAYVRSSPAVVGGKVFLGPDDGYVYCLNATNGNLLWKKDAGASVLRFDETGNIIYAGETAPIRSSPIVVGNRVYVGSLNNKTYCFDTNGNLQWTFTAKGPITSSPTVVGGALYITARNAKVIYKLNATTGSLIRNYTVPNVQYMTASVTVAKGVIFYPAQSGAWYAINETTGNIIWSYPYRTSFATRNSYSMLYFEGRVVFVDRFQVTCVNATTGEFLWWTYVAREVAGSPIYSPGRHVKDGKIYVATDARTYYCLNASDGRVLGSYDAGSNNWGTPAIYESKIYVGNCDMHVYCLGNSPRQKVSITISLDTQKIEANKTLTITGKLAAPIPNVPLKLTVTKPDNTTLDIDAKTDAKGTFSVTFTPNKAGWYGFTAWWEGYKYYDRAYSDTTWVETVAPSTPPPPPPPGGEQAGIPTEYIYAAAIIIVIVIIAAAGYMLMKKRKK